MAEILAKKPIVTIMLWFLFSDEICCYHHFLSILCENHLGVLFYIQIEYKWI